MQFQNPFKRYNHIVSKQGNCEGARRIIQNISHSLAETFLDPQLHNYSTFSFVPFCGFKGELSPSGKEHVKLQLPVCSNFSTVFMDGQLCHTVNMNTNKPESGPKNGFLLLLDPMMSSSLDFDVKGEESTKDKNRILSKGAHLQNSANLHIATLSPYTSSKNGTHILNALKIITGSESFLALSEKKKGCGNEEFEVCQSRRYLVAVEEQCGCVPWLATFFSEHKVLFLSFFCKDTIKMSKT